MGMLLSRPVPLHYSANVTQRTASGSRVWGRTNDRDERERTETWNQVGSFLLKSRSFELIRSQTTHHTTALLCRQGTLRPNDAYLSRVEGADIGVLHEEHVDEVDEDAGSQAGVGGPEGQPLVEDHEHQVAEETQQEEQLREEHQVHVVALPEVSAGRPQEMRTRGDT